jgi:hypothetical protein|tara:strand:- start:3379 stop:3636 length:258 start_codon:yes stop_codon:yes gene_type:complete
MIILNEKVHFLLKLLNFNLNLSNSCNFMRDQYKKISENVKNSHKISTFNDSSKKNIIVKHDVCASHHKNTMQSNADINHSRTLKL